MSENGVSETGLAPRPAAPHIPVLAFFSHRGGVGTTTLVYHLAWILAELDFQVLAVDLDPQANLSSAFLDDRRLEQIWDDEAQRETVWGGIQPLKDGIGDIRLPTAEPIREGLSLLVGDLALSRFEDDLAQEWPRCKDGQERSFRITSAFWRVAQGAGEQTQAQVILLDLGPNLGAINRAALLSADYLITPLAPDLFSLQGLRSLGPTLQEWKQDWEKRLLEARERNVAVRLPGGQLSPLGFVVMQHVERRDRPIESNQRWMERIPDQYRRVMPATKTGITDLLGAVPNFRSLMSMAQEARKPMFLLRPSDGAVGSHARAAQRAGDVFRELAQEIMRRMGLPDAPPSRDLSS